MGLITVWYIVKVSVNLQTIVRGPMDWTPQHFLLLTSSQKVIIGISKPTFHLILPRTEPICCIK